MVDSGPQAPGVPRDDILHPEEEGTPGLIPARVPSCQHAAVHVGWCEIRWR